MILLAYGTRPEYIKLKSLIHEFNMNNYPYKILFTGQHHDLVKEAQPDYEISIVEGRNRLDNIVHSIMNYPNIINKKIDYVMVQGDTTSAFAVALSAFHHGLKVIHLEAGLRTYDRENPYPEEINRRLISQIADIHLCPTQLCAQNLYNEHVNINNVYVVGNTIIDNLLLYENKCEYTNKILITLHRRENHHWLDQWFTEVDKLAELYPQYEFILPLHPNPDVQLHKHLLKHVNVINPLPYEEMLNLLVKTRLVITDSGGLQEESCFFNKLCLTCRIVTERPEAIGLSTLMVAAPEMLKPIFEMVREDYIIDVECPFGDGHSAKKILQILKNIT